MSFLAETSHYLNSFRVNPGIAVREVPGEANHEELRVHNRDKGTRVLEEMERWLNLQMEREMGVEENIGKLGKVMDAMGELQFSRLDPDPKRTITEAFGGGRCVSQERRDENCLEMRVQLKTGLVYYYEIGDDYGEKYTELQVMTGPFRFTRAEFGGEIRAAQEHSCGEAILCVKKAVGGWELDQKGFRPRNPEVEKPRERLFGRNLGRIA